jgi:2-polyprenyl-3-methyl-5-hydroxy-6-metoxy-1,4-benzoquinol methylase
MFDLNQRSFVPEILDSGAFTSDEYETCLGQIETINKLTTGYRPTLNAVAKTAALTSERPLRILDIGFGNGDTLRAIAEWSKANNVSVTLEGVELNPEATRLAIEQTDSSLNISFTTQNAFELPDSKAYHLIINALMTHHLMDSELETMMGWMSRNAKVGWFINDLHRHWLAYGFIKTFTRVFRFNRLIQNDAPLSVARGFRRDEWLNHAKSASLDPSRLTVEWWWPFRFGVFYRTLN